MKVWVQHFEKLTTILNALFKIWGWGFLALVEAWNTPGNHLLPPFCKRSKQNFKVGPFFGIGTFHRKTFYRQGNIWNWKDKKEKDIICKKNLLCLWNVLSMKCLIYEMSLSMKCLNEMLMLLRQRFKLHHCESDMHLYLWSFTLNYVSSPLNWFKKLVWNNEWKNELHLCIWLTLMVYKHSNSSTRTPWTSIFASKYIYLVGYIMNTVIYVIICS